MPNSLEGCRSNPPSQSTKGYTEACTCTLHGHDANDEHMHWAADHRPVVWRGWLLCTSVESSGVEEQHQPYFRSEYTSIHHLADLPTTRRTITSTLTQRAPRVGRLGQRKHSSPRGRRTHRQPSTTRQTHTAVGLVRTGHAEHAPSSYRTICSSSSAGLARESMGSAEKKMAIQQHTRGRGNTLGTFNLFKVKQSYGTIKV